MQEENSTYTSKEYVQILEYARKIAEYRGYTDLVNGLQPFDRLLEKYQAEMEELREARASKTRLHQLHKAADVYYYACQLQRQTGEEYEGIAIDTLWRCNLDAPDVRAAAIAKYQYRASAPNTKDEQKELELIAAAIAEKS